MSILETRERKQAPPRGGIFLPQDLVDQAAYALDRFATNSVDSHAARQALQRITPNTASAIAQERTQLLDSVMERGARYTKQREMVFLELAKLYIKDVPDEQKIPSMKAALNKLRIMYRGSETTSSTNAFKRRQVIGLACMMRAFDSSIPPWLPEDELEVSDAHRAVANIEQLKHDAAMEADIAGTIMSTALELQHVLAVQAKTAGFAGWSLNEHHYSLAEYPLDGTPYLQIYDAATDCEIHFTVADLKMMGGNARNATPDDSRMFLEHCLAAQAASQELN